MKYPKTDKTQISRDSHRGSYDSETIYNILDDSIYCVISYCKDNQPFAIPTGHVRIKDQLFIHGSVKSHFLNQLTPHTKVCISVSLMDGMVLAKSTFAHSFNYRSVILFADPFVVEVESRKLEVLKAFTEKMISGRWDDARKPTQNELKATKVVGFDIKEASAKLRSGPPNDTSSDRKLPVWTGVIPIRQELGSPEEHHPDTDSIPIPRYLKQFLDNV